MVIKVLDRASMGDDLSFESLSELGEVFVFDSTSQNELIERISDADVLVINKIKLKEESLVLAKKLKLICVFATGYDNIDVTYCKKAGIGVCNVPAYSTDSVALFTVANVLTLFTKLTEYRRHVSSGKYSEGISANILTPVFHEMKEMVWGIIGFGNIGRAVARVAAAFGAKIIVNKRTPVADYECVSVAELCERADIITVHCPLNESTKGLIGEEMISKMKPEVILVNEARGAVLDEEAVARAVKNGRIAAFGSDVYSVEPFSSTHPFYSIKDMDNVCFTPHAAWGAYEARVRCLSVICKNIKSFLNGKTLNRVDKSGQN